MSKVKAPLSVENYAAKIGVISFVKSLEGEAEYFERRAQRERRSSLNRIHCEEKAREMREAIAKLLLGAALARGLVDRP